MRALLNGQEIRKYFLADRVQQKRRATVLRAAGYCADRVAEEALGKFGNEYDGRAGRRQFAGTQTIDGAPGCSLAD